MYLMSAENCHTKFTPFSAAENAEPNNTSCVDSTASPAGVPGFNYYHVDDFSWEMALGLSGITIHRAIEKSGDAKLEAMRSFLSWLDGMTESTRQMSALEAEGFCQALRTMHWVTSNNDEFGIHPDFIRDIGFIIQVLEANGGGLSFIFDLAELGEQERIDGVARMYEYGVEPN